MLGGWVAGWEVGGRVDRWVGGRVGGYVGGWAGGRTGVQVGGWVRGSAVHEWICLHCCVVDSRFSLAKRSFKGFSLSIKGDATWIALSGSSWYASPGSPRFHVFPKFHQIYNVPKFPPPHISIFHFPLPLDFYISLKSMFSISLHFSIYKLPLTSDLNRSFTFRF